MGRRLRPWLLSLAVTQAAMAVAVELLWRRFSWAGNAVLLSTYALAPLVHVAMVALLLEVPARPMRARVITRPLPRPVYRLAQWLLVYSLLSPAIVTAVVNFVRIGYLNAPPPRDNYLPAPWDTLLNNLFSTPGYRIQGVALVAAALVVLHTWHRLRHGPVALPDSNRDRPDPALVSRSGP